MGPAAPQRFAIRAELLTAGGIALFAAAVGMVFTASWGRTPHFYQEVFGPAVMWACGRGFVEPAPGRCASLDAFLNPDVHAGHPPEVDRFACGDLPADLETRPLQYFQQAHRYLLFAAALAWKLFGVAWSALIPLYGILYGVAAASLYGLFRLGMGRVWASAGVLLLVVSPVQLNNLVRLRDYAKAPFLLGALFLMALLVARPLSRRARLGVCAAGGLWLGVGLGFRMDVSVALPAFAMCVLVFLSGPLRRTWPDRVLGVLLLAGGYMALGAPMLAAQGGSAKYHYFLMGQAEIYDQRLGVGGAPYQAVHRYFDSEALAVVQAHAYNTRGKPQHYDFFTPEHDAMGREVVRRMLHMFPADQMTRALAAIVRTVDELGSGEDNAAPREITNTFVRRLYVLHARLLGLLTRYGRYAIAAALLLLAAHRLRLAFAAFFLVLYFAGYGAIQFASRHYFHMQFLSLWPVLFLAAAGVHGMTAAHVSAARARWRQPAAMMPALCRMLVFAGVAVTAAAAPLWGLRWIQDQRVGTLLRQYDALPTEPLDTVAVPRGEQVLVTAPSLPQLPPPGERYFSFELLVAEFDTSGGDTPFMVVGDGNMHENAITWGGVLPRSGSGTTRVYFPAYAALWDKAGRSWSRFAGIELAPEHVPRLVRVGRATKPEDLPLLLTVTRPAQPERESLHQTFTR